MTGIRTALLTVFTLAVASCGGTQGSSESPTSTETVTTTATTGTTTTVPSAEVQVRTYFVRGEHIATAGRAGTAPDVAESAIEGLLAGPDAWERSLGFSSEIPAGTELLGIDIDGTQARIDLSGEFATGGGSLSMQLRVAQVVFTLTQFDTVETVTFMLDGVVAAEGVGGEGVPATDVGRLDFTDQIPLILVESPVPGDEVSSPFTLAGMSNTFEASLQYEVTDPSGAPIASGFTTATAGTGTWGTFSTQVDVPAGVQGPGAVTAFEEDMDTGGPRNGYTVPIVFS